MLASKRFKCKKLPFIIVAIETISIFSENQIQPQKNLGAPIKDDLVPCRVWPERKKSIKRRREQQNNKDFWRPHKINDARTQAQKHKENNLKFYVRTEMQSEDSGSTRQKGNRKDGLKQLNKWLYFEPRANIQNWIERINVIILFTPQVQDCILLFCFLLELLSFETFAHAHWMRKSGRNKGNCRRSKTKVNVFLFGPFFGGLYANLIISFDQKNGKQYILINSGTSDIHIL